jgi:hypothetical protein
MLFMLAAAASFEKESRLFEKYFKDVHHAQIGDKEMDYLVIRENNCGLCYAKTLDLVKSKITEKKTKIIYVYIGKVKPEANFLIGNKKVYFDSLEAFTKKNICPFSDCIITTKQGKIINIKKLG